MTRKIVSIFHGVLKPGEFQDALEEVYAAVLAGLQCYDLKREHISQCLKPMSN